MLTRLFPIELGGESPGMSVTSHVADLESLLAGRARGGGALLIVPGCWDAFSARAADAAGAAAISLTPRTMAMARHGRPEADLVTFGELAEAARAIRETVDLPLIVEAGGGFGNSLNVFRTVKMFERAGASAIDISDGVSPGSVQAGQGDLVVSPADMIGKVKAALDSRNDALVIARTRAAAVEGLPAAFDRAEAYLETGADLIIVESATDRGTMQKVAARLTSHGPLIHDLGLERSDSATTAVLDDLGYAVAVSPLALLGPMAAAAGGALAHLTPSGERTGRLGLAKY